MKTKEQRKAAATAWLNGLAQSGICIIAEPLQQGQITDFIFDQWLEGYEKSELLYSEYTSLLNEAEAYISEWQQGRDPLDTRDITYEERYSNPCLGMQVITFVAHEWGEYPASSVLAGQAKKMYLGTFDTVEELLAQYPQAQPSHPFMQPQVSLNHLPGEEG